MRWSFPAILALCACLVAPTATRAFQFQVPAGSGIQVIGVHPEPRFDPRPLVAHFPLANFLSFELDFATPSMALTFDQGIVTYYDESGSPYKQAIFGVTEFDQVAVRLGSNPSGSGANIPMGERILMFFPLEDLGHNEMPSSLDVALCFDEFAGMNGACIDPLLFQDIVLYEYHVPAGQTYIYPAQTPAEQGERWWSGGAYELSKPNGHRRGGLRRNDSNLTAWVNQRYAWDIGVTSGNGAGTERVRTATTATATRETCATSSSTTSLGESPYWPPRMVKSYCSSREIRTTANRAAWGARTAAHAFPTARRLHLSATSLREQPLVTTNRPPDYAAP